MRTGTGPEHEGGQQANTQNAHGDEDTTQRERAAPEDKAARTQQDGVR